MILNVKFYNICTSKWDQSSRSIAKGKSCVTMRQFQKLIQILV